MSKEPLENRLKEFCQSRLCAGQERTFVKIGYYPLDKKMAVYNCEYCGHHISKREGEIKCKE